jgi:hypothetical protein
MSDSLSMTDAKRMLEEILASTTDLQKRMVAQEDNLVALNSEVSSLKVDQGRFHVAVNNVQSQQMDTMGRSSIPTNNLQDPTSRTESSQTGGMARALLAAAAHQLRFPKYDGTEDPLPWLDRCDQFFLATATPDNEKVRLATFYMQGVAQQWYYMLERNQGIPTWPCFSQLANQRFGPPTRSNPLGELCHLCLQGSVADYTEAFLAYLSRCDTLTEHHEIAIFTAGLGEPLKTDVELQQPDTLEDAVGLARAYERRATVAGSYNALSTPRSSNRNSSNTATPAARPATTTTPRALVKSCAPPGTRLSRLTPEEMVHRREEGLCFNCPKKFSRGHLKHCSMKGIFLQEMEDGESARDNNVDDSNIEISLNAVSGLSAI